MSYLYDNRNNRRQSARPSHASAQGVPTLADYQNLARAYEEQKQRLDEQTKALHNTRSELEITKEALHKQSEAFKQLETEIVFTRAALEETQKQLDEGGEGGWQEKYTRLQAEVDNLRKRWEQKAATENAEFRRRLLTDMLPLADHLDLAMQHAPAGDDPAVKGFVGNIEATRRAFLEALRRYGVERIDPLGEPFDPNLHEAIGHAPGNGAPADHVAQVLQAGYVEGDRVIRPARVLISAG